MIKVEKCICKEDFSYSNLDTFTKGEMYFLRKSKNGRTIVRSNEGRWVIIEDIKMSHLNLAMNKFEVTGMLLFRSLRELRRLSL